MASGQRRTSSRKSRWSASTGPRQDTQCIIFRLINHWKGCPIHSTWSNWMSGFLVRVEWNVTFKKSLERLISCLCSWCSLARAQKCRCFPEHQTTTVHICANSVKKKKGKKKKYKNTRWWPAIVASALASTDVFWTAIQVYTRRDISLWFD